MDARVKFLLLLAALLAPCGELLAQSPTAAGDPFAALHARLAAAADNSLAAMRMSLKTSDAGVTSDPIEKSINGAGLGSIPLARVNAAQSRLLGLRVDAARIFAEEGVPIELLVVAEVESGFNPLALSPKGARGPWQLMPATAQRFGLRVNERTDERIHPERSTRAAARYLRELYAQFGDWLLALAAYNAGEQRVSTAIARGGTRDFWQLAQRRLLPEETRRYVPAVLNPFTMR